MLFSNINLSNIQRIIDSSLQYVTGVWLIDKIIILEGTSGRYRLYGMLSERANLT